MLLLSFLFGGYNNIKEMFQFKTLLIMVFETSKAAARENTHLSLPYTTQTHKVQ